MESIEMSSRDPEPEWLDVRAVARVHASSEQSGHPIGDAFSASQGTHWRAGKPGEQLIELRFYQPRDLSRIRLVFINEDDRTQQFTILWSSRRGETHREVVRQQFNFSRHGATREVEDYRVDLTGVETLQVRVIPDISDRCAFASLAELQLA